MNQVESATWEESRRQEFEDRWTETLRRREEGIGERWLAEAVRKDRITRRGMEVDGVSTPGSGGTLHDMMQSRRPPGSSKQSKPVMEINGSEIVLDDSLDYMVCFVSHEQRRLAVSSQTWKTLGFHTPAINTMVADMSESGSGHHTVYVVGDAGPYGEAVRKEAESKGIVQTKDKITQLKEEANGLLVQAASLNTSATPGQLQAFSVRLASLNEQFRALEGDMELLRDCLHMAALAVSELD